MCAHRSRIALVTDSTADIPSVLLERFDIRVIPQLIIWGQQTLIDGVDLDTVGFYERLKTDPVYPQTSQPFVTGIVDLFDRLAVDHEAIVALVISADVSGTVKAIQTALALQDPGVPVYTLDTRLISVALAFVVLRAAEVREQGADVEGILSAARDMMARIHITFSVDNLDALHRGGRIGGAKHLLGTALQIKPMLTWQDGHVEPLGRVRTRRKALDYLVDHTSRLVSTDQPIILGVAHGNCPDEAYEVAKRLRDRLSPRGILVMPITPAIGVHAGTGVIATAVANIPDGALNMLSD